MACGPGISLNAGGADCLDRCEVDSVVVRPPNQEAPHFDDAASMCRREHTQRDQEPNVPVPVGVPLQDAISSAAG